jgi:hypothetical protein
MVGVGRISRFQASLGWPNRFWRTANACIILGTTPRGGRIPRSQISINQSLEAKVAAIIVNAKVDVNNDNLKLRMLALAEKDCRREEKGMQAAEGLPLLVLAL